MKELSVAVKLCVKHTVTINYANKAEKQAVRLDPYTENNILIQPCYFCVYFENSIRSNGVVFKRTHLCVSKARCDDLSGC